MMDKLKNYFIAFFLAGVSIGMGTTLLAYVVKMFLGIDIRGFLHSSWFVIPTWIIATAFLAKDFEEQEHYEKNREAEREKEARKKMIDMAEEHNRNIDV